MADVNRVRPVSVAGEGGSAVRGVLIAAGVIAALYFGRDIVIPLALALLSSFLLAPVVRKLRVLRVPRGVAVALVVGAAFALVGALGMVISAQVGSLSGELPRYEANVRDKVAALRLSSWVSLVDRATDTLRDFGAGLRGTAPSHAPESSAAQRPLIAEAPGSPRGPDGRPRAEPLPGAQGASEAPSGALDLVQAFLAPLLEPLAKAALVVLFTIFMLLQREDLRDRFIRLFGAGDLSRTTIAMTDAAERLSRYFLLQAGLNAAFGIFIWAGLSLLGIPSPALWGIVAGLMRFVPFVGAFIGAVMPILLALAIEPGWSTAVWTAALFAIGEPVMGQIIEPLVYGRHTGLSPMAVIASATFWTWLWGPIGLILATPLTLCLVVLGQHAGRFAFFDVLLGDTPALTPEQSFYQRLLAGDVAEIAEQAESTLKDGNLIAYYDAVAFPGLRLAVADERSGRLDAARLADVADALDDVAATLADLDVGVAALPSAADAGLAALDVLVVAGRGDLDQASARMLASLLRRIGFGVRVEASRTLPAAVSEAKPRVIVVATLGNAAVADVRATLRRVLRLGQKVPVIIAVLGLSREEEDASGLAGGLQGAHLALSVNETVQRIFEVTEVKLNEAGGMQFPASAASSSSASPSPAVSSPAPSTSAA